MNFISDSVRTGGWLVAIYKAISFYDVDDPVFDEYEATVLAGKAAQ